MKKLVQRGAALLAAMLTVALVATFAAAALWQQWRTVEVEAAERSRMQSAWILNGALDWARLILREDFNADRTDHLAEPWAVPLQEARLSTFLAADPSNNMDLGDAQDVFLSGEIGDLQARLNLGALVQAGSLQPKTFESFQRLFEVLGLPQAQLAQLAENLRFGSDISIDNRNAARAPLVPQRVEQLAWLGVSPETVAALEPYVTVLPSASTKVNLNTASRSAAHCARPVCSASTSSVRASVCWRARIMPSRPCQLSDASSASANSATSSSTSVKPRARRIRSAP